MLCLTVFTTLVLTLFLSPISCHPAPTGHTGIWFRNEHPLDQYLSVDFAEKDMAAHPDLVAQDMTIAATEHIFLPMRPGMSPKFFLSPTPNNRSAEVGDKRDSDTAVEVTFAGFQGHTYYDVDIERGFSVPVWCYGYDQDWEDGSGCLADLLDGCPEHLKHFDESSGMHDQCLGDGSEASVMRRRKMCPQVYVQSDDEQTRAQVGAPGKIQSPLPMKHWVDRLIT